MSKKKVKKDDGIDPNAWLATYGDMVTLLLTFFVMLYSMSSIDAMKFKSISSALQTVMKGQGGKSIMEYNMNNGDLPIAGKLVPNSSKESNREQIDMINNMKDLIAENNLDGIIDVKEDSRGFIFELKDKILFESGKSNLKSASLPALDTITDFIKELPNDIIIEGHTDNVPINNSKYKDNWELSAARAYTVNNYFTKIKGLDPTRFYPTFLGDNHPLVNNDTEENRAKNRRVNILIKRNDEIDEGDAE
ncbi:flagellar motor protein MotB [Oceanirhabdus sp. W0125-5]|uniref:flagellar motor protein MotB n=1 Tax=Oceanirhabdus sp. W0125-5 TaxID=2999116 RepID=UPI0022F33411|nr:OmpA family protein [Oceanirhabdus sp. W0125-5]WBW95420.1 OmpA family protein [Oceanirhabdus sp. W0125-5]